MKAEQRLRGQCRLMLSRIFVRAQVAFPDLWFTAGYAFPHFTIKEQNRNISLYPEFVTFLEEQKSPLVEIYHIYFACI